MSDLEPGKLQTRFMNGMPVGEFSLPRRYTLTHSDVTGKLFMSIGPEYNAKQIGGFYTRLMRDEVLAEWKTDASGPTLRVYGHVSGGLVLGGAAWRNSILLKHMGVVIQAICYADRLLIAAHPELEQAKVLVHFRASQPKYDRVEDWGTVQSYLLYQRTT